MRMSTGCSMRRSPVNSKVPGGAPGRLSLFLSGFFDFILKKTAPPSYKLGGAVL
jgi:hypothetical protein